MRPNRLLAVSAVLAASLVATAQDQPPQPGPGSPPPEAPKLPPGAIEGGPPPGSPTSPPAGIGREQMWRPPSAEDWAKPVLITFQRTWDDAVAVARETGRPILACINMDGEVASEHYAGVRYRESDVAKLYEPYVCVIASVYRHTARDYDDDGARVLCPRFGSVTCGEHIAIEPLLYERFLDGKRIAPRHIMVEFDDQTGFREVYDVYYANDTDSIFRTITEGVAKRPPAPPVVRGDRPITDRVASRDVGDRVAVEAAYAKGDAAARRALLDAALANGGSAPVDLLRLAVFGLDTDLSKRAREALAKADTAASTELISEALKIPMDEKERDALIEALARIGKTSPRAQWLSVLHRGLAARSGTVDVKGWETAAAATRESAAEWYELEGRRQATERARRSAPKDPEAMLAFAEASLALAVKSRTRGDGESRVDRAFDRLAFEDARRAALEAQSLGAKGWRTDAVLALAAYYGGDTAEGFARAESAVQSMPQGEPGWNAMAVLTIFAESRFRSIKEAVKAKTRWPAQWLADVNAAYAVLLRHPLGTDAQVVWHYDFLTWLGAWERGAKVLDEGLVRFPESAALHDLFRRRVLRERGIEGLEPAYEALLGAPDAPAALARQAGAASVMAAEYFRRANNYDRSLASYERAMGHWERLASGVPAAKDEADHRIALCRAGRARIALERGDLDGAVAEMLASFERRPDSAGSLDGLNMTPAQTAQALLERLDAAKREDLRAKLEAALAKIDPALLVPKNE